MLKRYYLRRRAHKSQGREGHLEKVAFEPHTAGIDGCVIVVTRQALYCIPLFGQMCVVLQYHLLPVQYREPSFDFP